MNPSSKPSPADPGLRTTEDPAHRLFANAVFTSLFTVAITMLLSIVATGPPALAGEIAYPETRRGSQVDDYHGVEVADPYRWLEDLDSPETHAWMKAQESTLEAFLDPELVQRFEQRIEALGKTGTNYSVPAHADGRYFYTTQEQGQKHRVIRVRKGLDGDSRQVLDLNETLEEDEQFAGFSVSPSGRFVAYRVTRTGSRWGELRLLETSSSRTLSTVSDSAVTAASHWLGDETGFFYIDYGSGSRLRAKADEPLARVRFHRLQAEADSQRDVTVFTRPDESSWLYGLTLSADRRHLILSIFAGTTAHNRVLAAELGPSTPEFSEILGDGKHRFTPIGAVGERFFFYTDHSAANGRVIAVDPFASPEQPWQEVIPESEEVLAGGSSAGGNAMALIGDHLVLLYRRATVGLVRVFDLDGTLRHEVPLSAGWIGSGLVGDSGAPDEAWFSFNGFVEPSTAFRLDLETGKKRPFAQRDLPIDPDDYVLRNVHYESHDKTHVPLFIAHRKDLRRDGRNPVFMYGYGFGAWTAVPWYQPHLLAWLEMGGIYVLPGVRGGGEYGDSWHQAGIRLKRQNAIDDYIAAAEWLVEQGYTSPGRVVANGWSASGSLAAAAALQRPELFGAGLIGIPSLDLLRYHHFTTIRGWTGGYGSSDDPEEFRALYAYSPYQNLRVDRCRPPFLVTVGEHDQTTPPLHGYKFVAAAQHAAVQEASPCSQPALLKIVRGAGHAFGTTSEQRRRTQAEELAFLAQVLELDRGAKSSNVTR